VRRGGRPGPPRQEEGQSRQQAPETQGERRRRAEPVRRGGRLMDTSATLAALSLGEEKDWEFKAARGGLPGSVWDTYSAMANTDGGVIVLGVAQKEGRFVVGGVPAASKMKQDFWNLANNRGKISTNLLSNDDVTI